MRPSVGESSLLPTPSIFGPAPKLKVLYGRSDRRPSAGLTASNHSRDLSGRTARGGRSDRHKAGQTAVLAGLTA